MSNQDIYTPYKKEDFREYWYNPKWKWIEKFEIIRPLNESEKEVYKDDNDSDCEEMYLIESATGFKYDAFDNEILKQFDLTSDEWRNGLLELIHAFNEEELKNFIYDCKIENWLKKNL